LKNNSEIAEKLGTSGRNYVVEKLSIESIGREMLNVFQQIIREV